MAIPKIILELREHLEFAKSGPAGVVFVGPKGGQLQPAFHSSVSEKEHESGL